MNEKERQEQVNFSARTERRRLGFFSSVLENPEEWIGQQLLYMTSSEDPIERAAGLILRTENLISQNPRRAQSRPESK